MTKQLLGCLVASVFLATPALAQQLPPATAKPGECYAKVLIPAHYKTVAEQVLVHAGGTEFEKIPAVYQTQEKRVVVQEESFELVPVPAVYDIVSDTILVEPARVLKSVVPATYRTEEKQVMVSPARVEWKPGRGAYEKIDSATGDILCRVEVPAVYRTVMQTVLATQPKASETTIPAKYITIKRRVMKSPPTTSKKVIPTVYDTISVEVLVDAEKFETVKTLPKYSAIEKHELVSAESVEWRQILCETNTTPAMVKRIQYALVNAGFSIGTTPNGNFGPATKAAIRSFQLDEGLPTGGLTISTIRRLGL